MNADAHPEADAPRTGGRAQRTDQRPPVPRGRLVLHGGGGVDPEFRPGLLADAGGPAARVLIVPHASALRENWLASLETWRGVGARNAELLDLESPGRALAQIDAADLVWLGAGNQARLVESLAATPAAAALRRRHLAGLTVAGISAGVAALSAVMITGEDADETTGATHVAPGLGLWPEVILDQHVLTRDRLGRLERAVRDHPPLIGVGVDEDTSVTVEDGRRLTVAGDSVAVVVRLRDGRAVTERVAAGMTVVLAGDLA